MATDYLKSWACACLLAAAMAACTSLSSTDASKRLTRYINPYIGTGDHGHVFLGANVPFGFVQLGPTQPCRGWDWCSGYHYSDSVLIGFSHTHLSGTGIGDLGDVAFLPVTDGRQRMVRFAHQDETVRPGYYALTLADEGVKVELTATTRTGFHRYRLLEGRDTLRLRVDLAQGIGWDALQQAGLTQQGEKALTGYRHSKGWANNQKLFFSAHFSSPIVQSDCQGDSVAVLTFVPSRGELLVKVGLSAVSEENASLNLQSENPGWNFDAVAKEADCLWDRQLGKVEVDTPDETVRRIFYTALYHTMIAPSVFCDVNGDYRGADGEIHRQADFVNYTTWSLWDTYRALHPLATLIHPERQKDWAQTLLHIFQEQGKLPVWHLMGCETDCMVGNPAIPVLADMVLKGVEMDTKEALLAMLKTTMLDERAQGLLIRYGYIPFDLNPTHESTAKGLEYAVADGCVAQVAHRLGWDDEAAYYEGRSCSYRHYFDSQTRFMRGRDSKGRWREPFHPRSSSHQNDDYCEGTAWQWSWMVPHDVKGLIELMGGREAFVEKLDSLFLVDSTLEGENASADISGLIGQYAHGNEPSHHVIYLYNYAGMPWKAAPRLRQVMQTLYHDAPAGLCGNEDVGQMSAWYVLSAMGLYQVEPAGGIYQIGSPLFRRVSLQVGEGKTFSIVARDNSPENIYVCAATLNGEPYSRSYITYQDIMQGGVLELQMGNTPGTWGRVEAAD